MARRRLGVGEYGEISYRPLGRRRVRARCKVRDADGRVRDITREGSSNADARARLLEALSRRPGFTGSEITSETTIEATAAVWLAEIARQVELGNRAPNTARVYRSATYEHIVPGVGGLTLREATTPRLDAFLVSMREHHGAGITKTARTVLRNVLGYAVRQGAITVNPMREVSRLEGGAPQRLPRALTSAERRAFADALDVDEVACWHDLPDLVRVMLGTGARIGEALALRFEDLDVDERTLRIEGSISRVTGEGLVRGRTKSSAGVRTLRLPGWTTGILVRRREALGDRGPIFPSVVSRKGSARNRRGGGWRDPSNTGHALQDAAERTGFDWLTSHAFRKTVATVLSESGRSARDAADQLGHSKVSMTQDVYFGRGAVSEANADALEDMFD